VPPTRISHCSNHISSVLSICHTGEEAEEEEGRKKKKICPSLTASRGSSLYHNLCSLCLMIHFLHPTIFYQTQARRRSNPWNSVFSHLCAWVLSNSLMEKRKRYATSFYDAFSVQKA